MRKIVLNIIVLIFLFGSMYCIGNKVLYPIDNIEYIKKFSEEYNIDPYTITSIANLKSELTTHCFNESENKDKNYNEDDIKIKKILYSLSKYKKTLSDEKCLTIIAEKELGLPSDEAKEYSLNILRNRAWYKIFHNELKK